MVLTAAALQEGLRLPEHLELAAAILDLALGSEDAAPLCAHLSARGIPLVVYSGYSDRLQSRRDHLKARNASYFARRARAHATAVINMTPSDRNRPLRVPVKNKLKHFGGQLREQIPVPNTTESKHLRCLIVDLPVRRQFLKNRNYLFDHLCHR